MSAFAKLPKSITQETWFSNSEALHVFVFLLTHAVHKPTKTIWNGIQIELKPGEWITTRNKIAAATNLKPTTIERAINTLKAGQAISVKSSTTSRLFSITYEGCLKQEFKEGGQRTDNERTANGLQTDTKEERKNKEFIVVSGWDDKKYDEFFLRISNDINLSEMVQRTYRIDHNQFVYQLQQFFRQKKALQQAWHHHQDCRKNFFFWLQKLGDAVRAPIPEKEIPKAQIDDWYDSRMAPIDKTK